MTLADKHLKEIGEARGFAEGEVTAFRDSQC